MVDDALDIVVLLRDELEDKGYEVFTATNPADALKILEKEKIDIVITDLRMETCEAGIELLCEIKSKYPHIEVIILTAYGTFESMSSCFQNGGFDYLNKGSINIIDKLAQSIERCVQHINSKKEDPLKAENIELKRKLDFLTTKYDRLKQTSQQRIKEHPDSMTLSYLGDMIAGITHSLTNEILIIRATFESLVEKAKDDPNIKKYKRLLRSVKYCNVLLHNIRGLLLEGKPTSTEIDIKEVINDIITLFEYRIPSNVKLTTEIGPGLPKLLIDKNQIEQVLVNTIYNAIEAMPEGGELSIKAKRKEASLNIEIRDTGVGIPKENLDNVFELYFSTKKEEAGLGLYLTKRIVERHSGNISIKSSERKGTTITINFPISEEK